ncbi:VOC family protein [Methanosphaera sp.]
MKFNYITIMVRNLDESLKFYEELVELSVQRTIETPMGNIAFLANDAGETMIEIIEFEGVPKVETKALTMSFKVEVPLEDVHKKALLLGYNPSDIINEGQKPPYFNLEDPDGILVEFSI